MKVHYHYLWQVRQGTIFPFLKKKKKSYTVAWLGNELRAIARHRKSRCDVRDIGVLKIWFIEMTADGRFV